MHTQSQAVCNGTFGELIQGVIHSKPFLVTLPIQKFSCVKYLEGTILDNRDIYAKSYRAADILREKLGKKGNYSLVILSELTRGKGLASSSADIVATLKAILHNEKYDEESERDLISSICRQVEPTDGVMYSGFNAYYHHDCLLKESLGFIPFEIIGIMEEGEVDTLKFNSKNIKYSNDELRKFEIIYQQLKFALKIRNTEILGKCATMSAQISQNYLPKKNFDEILEICLANRACGVCVAHSGTAIGIILNITDPEYNIKKSNIVNILNRKNFAFEIYRSTYSKIMSYDV
ncbi:GHMP family kinase ATP-binding protein [Fluviispira vulneris]|uniref:GHMP family kinase ATP-binding protein n=1 Tax=Fluviispira vulneris TaxID=2763012 RepID=UPI001645CFFE|nr:kinase [Fluviispira vulneris]